MDHAPALPPLGLLDAKTDPERVSLRALLESNEFQNSKPTLSVALGRTAAGAVQTADLSAMPHFLIGGAPLTGKRAFLKALLTTLLLRCGPGDLRLLLVDSTREALLPFAGIPHLLAPVLTEPFHPIQALMWAVAEMERRYTQLAAAGARSVNGYNEGSVTSPIGLADYREGKRLHHVVVVFTELAPVMSDAKAEAEQCIFNLSCTARAAGVHLVIATDDLSPLVFSGMVNVSVPARIAFKVSSPCHSRSLIFKRGAEALRPSGDAFFVPPPSFTPVRIHTPFVSDEEVARVTSYWRTLATSPTDAP